ncbi:MAG: serine dehydratase subunit alpha family protein [Clostridia bacterium]|nr:serine dehydratase subunit alpha family protein [Clostridia bacterium]
MNEIKTKLINAVKGGLTPSLGVTEPGAIAYAASCAARALGGSVKRVSVRLNSGIYKNSFTCAVPGTDGIGCALAAALGAVCGKPERRLMATEGASEADIAEAEQLVARGLAVSELASISPDILIEAEVETELGKASATVKGRHDRLTELVVNGVITLSEADDASVITDETAVSSFSLKDILDCVEEASDIEFLDEAVNMDMELYAEGRRRGLMPLTDSRCAGLSDSCRLTAERITCGAIEARVRGAAAPAMAITGSGSHGIISMLPIHGAALCIGADKDVERRSLLLSALITKYIKELSGLLSTACGCVLAGGTGAALGLTYLYSKHGEKSVSRGELASRLTNALNSMAASVTGMICHGGNTGCSLKAAVGVNMAFAAARMAQNGFGAECIHGILGKTPEETMRNMGRIARDMLPVESTVVDIMRCK